MRFLVNILCLFLVIVPTIILIQHMFWGYELIDYFPRLLFISTFICIIFCIYLIIDIIFSILRGFK